MSEKIRDAMTETSTEKIVLERTYRATLQELWDLWTTREGFGSWWAPEGFRIQVHALDARAGGELRYDMIAASPEVLAVMKELGLPPSHLERARFSVFRPLEQLVLRLMIDFVPGVAPYESTIVIDFFSSGEWSRMVVTLLPMHDETFTRMAGQGLESQLGNLDGLLVGRGHQAIEATRDPA
jgi:uncharacterized protein YndB with AHSA1/START domain